MKYISTLLFLVFSLQLVSGQQRQTRADRYYEKNDFINAAEQYLLDFDKKPSKHILERLANSYYNIYEYRRATLYLSLYMKGKYPEADKSFDNQYNFMMYQLRSALGDHQNAVEYLATYQAQNNDFLDKEKALSEIAAFKEKDEDYTVKKSMVSTEYADFGALKVDSMLYFVSDRSKNGILDKTYNWTHRPFLDIYSVPISEDLAPIGEPEPLEKVVNSKLHEGNFCFSADKKTLYFSRSNSQKGKQKFDTLQTNQVYLYTTHFNDSIWSPPEMLPFNSPGYSMEHPTLSTDGSKLYFASDIPGGEGDFDLYYVAVEDEGTYGTPVNLGQTVNTPHREQFPFVSADDNLFFSSNGHLGLGMMDLFVSENVQNGFTKPINLGAPINSQFDDFSITYYEERKGFFSSNRNRGNDDIYTFDQIGEIFIREYEATFEIRDSESKEYIKEASAVLTDSEEARVYENTFDTIPSFTLNVLPGTYQFEAKAKGYFDNQKFTKVLEKEDGTYIIYLTKEPTIVPPQNTTGLIVQNSEEARNVPGSIITPSTTVAAVPDTNLATPTATAPCDCNDPTRAYGVQIPKMSAEDLEKALIADPIGPKVFKKDGKYYFDVAPIFFDYDRWNIRADSKKELEQLAAKLDRFKMVRIKISSHTDNRGSDSYNRTLSNKRAKSTRDFLALEGYVNARRMQFEGLGETQPLVDCQSNCSESQHQDNRRSDFEILNFSK